MIVVYLDVMGPSLDPRIASQSQWRGEAAKAYRRRFRDHLVSTAMPGGGRLVILRVNPGDQHDSRTVFDSIADGAIDHIDPSARDIGAILSAARQLPPDELTLFVGSTCYPVDPNWLNRLQSVWDKSNPGAIAPFASREVYPHLRTACFATLPRLLTEYPFDSLCGDDYYRFEHGPDNFTLWLESRGYVPLQVTKSTVFAVRRCRRVKNGYRRGDQSELLVRDRHVDVYASASPGERFNMRLRARGIEVVSLRNLGRRVRARLRRLGRP